MLRNLLDIRLSIRQLAYLAVTVGIPYLAIGLFWATRQTDHLRTLTGFDLAASTAGEIVAWPVLLFANVTLV
ncbi:hypothetical protein ACWDTP_31520 [Mycobacterium sp. NPDC003449]